MEFNFDIQKYFTSPLVKVHNAIIPENFRGDKREFNLCYQHISEIVDKMGLASAEAQGLKKPITSASKLQNSEHTLYLLTDVNHGSKKQGVVVGLLKMGWKNLYLFNPAGECVQKNSLCVLDFYVHESMQRRGCGNTLFEHMLADLKVQAHKLAVDKPSETFLCFLKKHYGLRQIVPQNNHFVVYTEFFDNINVDPRQQLSKLQWSSCKENSTNYLTKPRHVHSQLW